MASFRTDDSGSPVSPSRIPNDYRDMSDLVCKMDKVIRLLQEQRSTITYVHQFGVWFLGIGVILSFYYNYVLLQPILWTLFGVLFSYVALYSPKVKVVKGLVFLLGPRSPLVEELDASSEDLPKSWWDVLAIAIARYIGLVWTILMFLILPSSGAAASSMYFSILYRLMFAHFYNKTILLYFPDTSVWLVQFFFASSILMIIGFVLASLRHSSNVLKRAKIAAANMAAKANADASPIARSWTQRVLVVQDKLGAIFEWARVCIARLVLPQAHLLAAVLVLFGAIVVVGTIAVWTVFAVSDELVYIYRNLSHLVRLLNTYLSQFSGYTSYVNQGYEAASEWIASVVMADSASAKTRDLYEFFSYVNSHQRELVETVAKVAVLSGPLSSGNAALILVAHACRNVTTPATNITTSKQFDMSGIGDFCSLPAVYQGAIAQLGNATLTIVSSINQDVEALAENPFALLEGFWELMEYFSEELKSGGTIAKGGDYLLTGLEWLKEIVLQSGSISFAAIGSGFSIFTFLFDSVLQALIYVTLLFLLLQSNVGFYHYTAVLLHFVDPSTMLYRAIHRALRAILISSLKMAVFHAAFTWLLFSYTEFPLVCIPTIVAFLLGVVPVVSPVIVPAIALPIWTYTHDENFSFTILLLAICFVVWWSVGTSIYAEIPDSSVWMTTFSVGLGISLFGARGVIIGPAIATIPFALYAIGSAYISGDNGGFPGFSRLTPQGSPKMGGVRSRGVSDSMSGIVLRAVSRRVKRSLKKRITIEPVNVRESTHSATSSPVSMDKLISGSNREKLFDYIMSTPKGDKKNN